VQGERSHAFRIERHDRNPGSQPFPEPSGSPWRARPKIAQFAWKLQAGEQSNFEMDVVSQAAAGRLLVSSKVRMI
jgi:hypothetical protein